MWSPNNGIPRLAVLARLARALILPAIIVLAGCQNLQVGAPEDPGMDTDRALALDARRQWLEEPVSNVPTDVWERMRIGFQLQEQIGSNPRIERQRLWFASNPRHMQILGERGSLYLHYVVERLEERGMPLELALLPAIESAYNPLAYSHAHAAGLWQFIPSTGRHFNLRQTNWYDGRRDITASTDAALTYLGRLHEMFNGDWLLALAAYNAGEGTVSRAIERNQKLGLPTDYWNLPLPKETQDYVPKLLALSQVVRTPEAYGLNLAPIANEPYFEQVQIKQRLDLNRVAKLAELELDELQALNPAYKQRITMDGPDHLLVPTAKAELLAANLSLLGDKELVDWQQYTVRPGDSLHAIAYRHQLTVNTLKEINDLKGNNLRIGQVLSIPAVPGSSALAQVASNSSQAPAARQYKVRSGDNLWQIARNHGVSVTDLKRWNSLQGNALKLGQVLRIESDSPAASRPSTASSQQNSSRQNVTYYQVRQGDSLYLIAKRFKVDLTHLQRWNPRTAPSSLKPGQTLTLYLAN